MFISYSWLFQLTHTSLSAPEVKERLTMVGLAIDAVEGHGDDAVLDVEVPSNRPDCLSHIGIAREVTVIENGRLNLPPSEFIETDGRSADLTSVEIKQFHKANPASTIRSTHDHGIGSGRCMQ